MPIIQFPFKLNSIIKSTEKGKNNKCYMLNTCCDKSKGKYRQNLVNSKILPVLYITFCFYNPTMFSVHPYSVPYSFIYFKRLI